jgi:hypothetical protein
MANACFAVIGASLTSQAQLSLIVSHVGVILVDTELKTTLDALKTSPGAILVGLGFATIYFLTALRLGDREPTTVDYLAIGFAFMVAIAGIFLLFKDLGKESDTVSLESSVGSSDIETAAAQFGKNYDILRKQATQGFVLAGTFMAMGILVILAGSLGEMFGFTSSASNLTTIAGVVIEVVSGLGLYLFKETFKRLNSTSDKLHEMWKLLAAFKKAENLPGEKKTEVTINLINKLVEQPAQK